MTALPLRTGWGAARTVATTTDGTRPAPTYLEDLQARRTAALFAELRAELDSPEREVLARRTARLRWLIQQERARLSEANFQAAMADARALLERHGFRPRTTCPGCGAGQCERAECVESWR